MLDVCLLGCGGFLGLSFGFCRESSLFFGSLGFEFAHVLVTHLPYLGRAATVAWFKTFMTIGADLGFAVIAFGDAPVFAFGRQWGEVGQRRCWHAYE